MNAGGKWIMMLTGCWNKWKWVIRWQMSLLPCIKKSIRMHAWLVLGLGGGQLELYDF